VSFTLELTRRAYADIDLSFAFVTERSGISAARRWRNELFTRLSKLIETPETWPIVDEPE
jgi:plasmid stabilization system protein ParE